MKKTFKKFLSLSIAICVVMAALVLPSAILPVAALYSGGDGTSGSPYLISTAADLLAWQTAASAAGGGERYDGKYLALTNNIDLTGQGFTGITGFYGTFDGNGHTISGINISSTAGNVGFFASVTNNGTVRNLTLSGSITSTGDAIGGFAGYVSSASFVNCVNNVNVTGRRVTGGFCGQVTNSGTAKMTYCTNNGNITASVTSSVYSNNGGFIGQVNSGTTAIISLSENTGYVYSQVRNVVGGFVAQCLGTLTVENCINSGKVEGLSMMGGIVADISGAPAVTVKNSINVGEIKTIRGVGEVASLGGILGYYTNSATEETFENAFYRDSDYNFNGASDQQPSATPRGTVNNTATDWTDGTIVDLLNTSKTYYKQGGAAPELYSLSGAGTEADPYKVTCGADLDYISAVVNDGITDFSGEYLRQTANITYNDNNSLYENWGTSAPAKTFTRIGNTSHYFRGNFDGDNYSIFGLYISTNDDVGTGLFGATHNNKIKNLHIKKSYIKGNVCIGGISGYSMGATFTNCSFDGMVYSTANSACRAGGIIGDAVQSNTLYKCYTSGLVSAYAYSGGLIGRINGAFNGIVNCYSVATVDATGSLESAGPYNGGLVGLVQYKSGTFSYVQRSFYYNSSFSTGDTRKYIIGHIDNSDSQTGTANVSNCYYLAASADGSSRGTNGTAAQFTDGTVLNAINGDSAFKQGALYPVTVDMPGWDGVSASASLSGSGTEDSPYLISSAADLKYFANQVNGGTSYSGSYIKLTTDIDLNDMPFTPIGNTASDRYFRGTFDGGNYTVSGLNISSSSTAGIGFFGACHNATVKNLNVKGNIAATVESAPVAGIAGVGTGLTLKNCSFDGTVSSVNPASTYGNSFSASGLISNITGWVNIDRCAVSGIIDGYGRGGGFLGALVDNYTVTITNSYCDATVTGIGAYDGDKPTSGGLIGFLQNGTISVTDCFFYGTAPSKRSNGLAGPIINYHYSGTLNLTRVYYNSDNAALGDGASFSAADDGVGKAAAEFADGTVLALINSANAFKQGTEHPVFTGLAFKSHSLVLTDSIGVNFFVDLSKLNDAEKESSYMSFSITEGTKPPKAQRADFDSEAKNASGYYRFTCNINSVQMAETITPVLHYGGSNMITGETYSVRAYIDEIVNNYNSGNSLGSSAQLVALVKSIGNYGYHAQQYFTAKTFTALPSSYARTYNDEIHASIKAEMESKALTGTNGLSGITNGSDSGQFQYNLNFDTTTSIMLRIYSGNVRFTRIERANADYTDRRNDFTNTRCTLYLLHLKVSQLSDVITVEGTVDGNSFTIPVSAMSYVYGVLNKGNATTQAKNVVSALYDYHMSAIYYAYQISLDRDLNADWL